MIRGEAPPNLAPVERLVWNFVLVAGTQRTLEDPGSALDGAGDVQELLPGPALELSPKLVSAPHQRHVRRVLEVGEPDDPRDPV